MEEQLTHGNYMENFQGQDIKDFYPGTCRKWYEQDNAYYFKTDDITLQITPINDKILRFRYANDNLFENDFSYAIDPKFKPGKPKVKFEEKETEFIISTDLIICYIQKNNLATTVTNKNGLVLMEDEKGFHWEKSNQYGGNIVFATKKIQSKESFYGLGDKSCGLNLRGRRFQNWGSDTYGYGTETDPLYKNIPFFLGLHHKTGYGIFLDNSFKTFFDFGLERKNVFSFWAEGGEMNYYFIYGPDLLEVSETYTRMTGLPEMPPRWALGYQQSKWSYYPEQVVRDLANKFREKQIPCDVIHLDIDYMDGFRCFTWDKKHFPDPKKLISDLEAQGFKVVVIIDPGIKVDDDYWVHQQALENGYFCKRADGPLFKGSVWPGICHFPDFTAPKVRDWWAGLFTGLISDGVKGVWNDMNEPAVFEEGTFPADVRHDYDGNPCSHLKGHNVYGMQMVRATYEGLKRERPNNRPFAITRSAYSGTQRFAAIWTGDNVATWEHLKIANIQCQRLSASGMSFVGSDVGGFINSPDGELYTRWVQMAVFHPFFRTHSSGDHGDKEPWTFGEPYETLVKKAIETRYRLLPYLYTTFYQYYKNATPMLRSSSLVHQQDPETYNRKEEFMLGDHILVCPVSQPKVEGRWLYLPDGEWYDFWTDAYIQNAGEIWKETEMETIPVFIRAGAVLPLGPKMQYVGESIVKEIDLHIYHAANAVKSSLYDDEGDGYGYENDEFSHRTFNYNPNDKGVSILQQVEGKFKVTFETFRIILHGFKQYKVNILIDGKEVTIEKSNHQTVFTAPSNFDKIDIIRIH